MAFKSSYHRQPCRLPKLGAGWPSVGGHNYEWPLSLLTSSSHAGYPSWELKRRQLGVTNTNGLQVFLPPVTMPVVQAGCWRGVSWGSRIQMAFKSSYHQQPYWLPKLGTGGALIGGHDYKWPSSLLTTYSHAGHPSWTPEGASVGGHDSNMVFKWSFEMLLNQRRHLE